MKMARNDKSENIVWHRKPTFDDRGTRNICCTNSPKCGERIICLMVSLRESHAASTRRSGDAKIMIGDVVLLQNDKTKRVLWKLAIIKELLTGVDSRVRATVVQVSGSRNLLKRSIKHLIPIEVQSKCDKLAALKCPDLREISYDRDMGNRPHWRAAINGEFLWRLRL